jgi:hypothetical protein
LVSALREGHELPRVRIAMRPELARSGLFNS